MLAYYDLIYLMHFLFLGPLFIYIGYYKEKTPKEVFNILLALGIGLTIYHAYLFGRSMYFKSQVKTI